MAKKEETNETLCTRRNRVGGQAVLEGIMMRAGNECATACRKSDGSIAVDRRTFVSVRKKHKALNIPILRGIINFVEMLILSFRILTLSAEMMGIDEDVEEGRFEKWMKKHLGIGVFDVLMVVASILGVALCLFLFMYLPTLAAKGISYLTGIHHAAFRALIEGVMKILIFISYIILVSLMKDIRRTFEYHGAEHKTIACFESGEELTPENARRHSRFHPRCGTSFMFVMILLGIFAGFFVRMALPHVPNIVYVLIRLLILPLVVGLGYEFIMFAGKHENVFTRTLSAPGLWMQRLTTKEPDDSQLEVAIVATKCALPEEFPDFNPAPYLENAKKDSTADTEEGKETATETVESDSNINIEDTDAPKDGKNGVDDATF